MTDEQTSIIEFPCHFPIKVMGKAHPEFESSMIEIVRKHAPDLSDDMVKTRPSKAGNYLAMTFTIIAIDQDQLDNIYRELSAHEMVSMAL